MSPGYVTVDQLGALRSTSDVYEKSRATPMGHWEAQPFNAAEYWAVAPLTWTVAAGQFGHSRYTLIGKTMTWSLAINASTFTGSPAAVIRVLMPGNQATGPAANHFSAHGTGAVGGPTAGSR